MDLKKGRGSAFLMVICVLLEVGLAMAKSYSVGDTKGWGFSVNYQEWASQHAFTTSDTLAFNYTPPLHSVFEVSKEDYDSCSISNPMVKYTSGSDTVKITAPEMYFICGVPGHCSVGMKVAISTSSTPATAETPAAASTPSAPPSANGKNAAASLQSASAGILLVSAFLEAAFLLL